MGGIQQPLADALCFVVQQCRRLGGAAHGINLAPQGASLPQVSAQLAQLALHLQASAQQIAPLCCGLGWRRQGRALIPELIQLLQGLLW